MKLSKRLACIASYVPAGSCVLDVGCDHAFLPIALVQSGVCPFAIASDVRSGPLRAAEAHVAERGLGDRIRTVLCDGIPADYKQIARSMERHLGLLDTPVTLVTAGMGGMLMRSILSNASGPAAFDAYIASPQKDALAFRRYITENGLRIADEAFIAEDGKYYPVICAVRTDVLQTLTDFEALYGPVLLKKKDPLLTDFLERRMSVLSGILTDIPKGHGRREELLREMQQIREYL
ncbi:MAG: SAM-dependent methyltransferase [Lachnospiraceae bacterium]|nr:SAM-dependent methyltransferase [Lachnospiraceae bacterium]